jgi:hypothetical protein
MTNHPTTTLRVSGLAIGAAAAQAFSSADRNPTVRQVYEVAELGMADPSGSHTPDYLMVQAAPGQRVDAADFRDELSLANRGGRLRFDIFVAGNEKELWNRIGYIEFTQDVVSETCDHRLHFHHPRWRPILR